MPTAYINVPVENGRSDSTNPCEISQSNESNITKWTAKFSAAITGEAHYTVYIPPTYSGGTITVRMRWRVGAGTGSSVVWNLYYALVTHNSAYTGFTSTQIGPSAESVPGTGNLAEKVYTFSGSAETPGQLLIFRVQRDGGDAGDDFSGDAEIVQFMVEYAFNPAPGVNYIFTPANALTIPNTSVATLSETSIGSTSFWTMLLPDNNLAQVDGALSMSPTFGGNLKAQLIYHQTSSANAYSLMLDAARMAVGENAHPALSGTPATLAPTPVNLNNTVFSSFFALPVTPLKGDLLYFRLERDAADANAGTLPLYGIAWEYSLGAKNPSVIRLDPKSASIPPTNGATITRVDDSVAGKWVVVFPNDNTTARAVDFKGMQPASYANGGTVRLQWRTTAASGNVIFRITWAESAVGEGIDPALASSSGNISAAVGGANLLNETSYILPSGLTASEITWLRIERLSDVDAVEADVEVISVFLETNQV